MASQNDSGFATFVASGALTAYLAVNVQSDGTIKVCADNVRGIGMLQEDVLDGGYGRIKLWSAPGPFMAAVSGTAITAGTTYQIITGGYVGVSTGAAVMRALQNGVASAGIVVEFAENY